MLIHQVQHFTPEEINQTGWSASQVKEQVEFSLIQYINNELETARYLKPVIDTTSGVRSTINFFTISSASYEEIRSILDQLSTDEHNEELCDQIRQILNEQI